MLGVTWLHGQVSPHVFPLHGTRWNSLWRSESLRWWTQPAWTALFPSRTVIIRWPRLQSLLASIASMSTAFLEDWFANEVFIFGGRAMHCLICWVLPLVFIMRRSRRPRTYCLSSALLQMYESPSSRFATIVTILFHLCFMFFYFLILYMLNM